MKVSDLEAGIWLYEEWGYGDKRQSFGKKNLSSVLLRILKPKLLLSRSKSTVYKQENVPVGEGSMRNKDKK